MPREVVGRIRAANEAGAAYRSGWSIDYLPSPRAGNAEIRPREIEEAIRRAGDLGGAHVLGLSKQDGAVRKAIGREIRPYFRFLWLKSTLLSKAHSPDLLIGDLNAVLEQEETWAISIRPTSVASALLLPSTCFVVDRAFESIWEEAEESGNSAMFGAVERRLDAFRARYWNKVSNKGSLWVDSVQKIFDHTGPRHADAPSPRDYKYSYPIPSGFHYDVSHLDRRAFRILDNERNEQRVTANGYINVDPHGHLRAGSR